MAAGWRTSSSTWLAGGFWDLALRDFGLLLGALALARLATAFERRASASARE